MAAGIVVAALVLSAGAVTHLILRRRGRTPGTGYWIVICGQALVCGVCVWAFATHRPFVAIGVLVAGFVVPEFVVTLLRVRRSRRR
jgi:hypothetical protein